MGGLSFAHALRGDPLLQRGAYDRDDRRRGFEE